VKWRSGLAAIALAGITVFFNCQLVFHLIVRSDLM
jgi:hypothetical protein